MVSKHPTALPENTRRSKRVKALNDEVPKQTAAEVYRYTAAAGLGNPALRPGKPVAAPKKPTGSVKSKPAAKSKVTAANAIAIVKEIDNITAKDQNTADNVSSPHIASPVLISPGAQADSSVLTVPAPTPEDDMSLAPPVVPLEPSRASMPPTGLNGPSSRESSSTFASPFAKPFTNSEGSGDKLEHPAELGIAPVAPMVKSSVTGRIPTLDPSTTSAEWQSKGLFGGKQQTPSPTFLKHPVENSDPDSPFITSAATKTKIELGNGETLAVKEQSSPNMPFIESEKSSKANSPIEPDLSLSEAALQQIDKVSEAPIKPAVKTSGFKRPGSGPKAQKTPVSDTNRIVKSLVAVAPAAVFESAPEEDIETSFASASTQWEVPALATKGKAPSPTSTTSTPSGYYTDFYSAPKGFSKNKKAGVLAVVDDQEEDRIDWSISPILDTDTSAVDASEANKQAEETSDNDAYTTSEETAKIKWLKLKSSTKSTFNIETGRRNNEGTSSKDARIAERATSSTDNGTRDTRSNGAAINGDASSTSYHASTIPNLSQSASKETQDTKQPWDKDVPSHLPGLTPPGRQWTTPTVAPAPARVPSANIESLFVGEDEESPDLEADLAPSVSSTSEAASASIHGNADEEEEEDEDQEMDAGFEGGAWEGNATTPGVPISVVGDENEQLGPEAELRRRPSVFRGE